MGILDFLTNKDKYEGDEYTDEYESEGMEPQGHQAPIQNMTSQRPNYTTVAQHPTKMQVVVVEPKTFESAEKIAECLRQMKPVIINFEDTESHVASRIVDFVSGSTFSLDGKIEKVGKDIFIVSPSNVAVDFSEKAYTDVTDNYGASSWKESRI